MKTVPIHNPVVPFLGQIPGGVRNGLVLKIRGEIQGCSSGCQIDLQQGPATEPRDDVMLHLSIRPQENVIVRNHLVNQQYGREERCGGCPIQANESFEITIVAEAACYNISVNGQHFCTFNHRLPIHLAKYISVRSTGNIQYILVENDLNHRAVHNPVVSFLEQIPGGMRTGHVLKIRGIIHEHSSRLIIDLQQGPAVDSQDDVMLHLSIRSKRYPIVRNHYFNHQFGSEELCGNNPIKVNESFEITIEAEEACYKILINGQHFCTFNHRLPMHLVQYIIVRGTGKIQSILNENDMATVQIRNPVVSFLGQIPGGMRTGLVFKFCGQIQESSNRFTIDLQKGPAVDSQDDVMLHLSIRSKRYPIVRNHYFNHQFGSEELCGNNPIKVNESFDITIVAEAACYRILINGQHFCTFNHRLSMNLAQYILIRGTGTIQSIFNENMNQGSNSIII